MSFNGSGTFQINSAGQPVVTATVISSTVFNALTADLATGLSTCITKDGQTATTARIPFASGINSTLATDATNTTTGSILSSGGIGIAKAAWIGGLANIAGALTVTGHCTFEGVTSTGATGTGLLVFGTSPTFTTPILGTPTSGTLTNCTLPVGGITGLGTGVATFLATPSSANLIAAVTDETGTGALVFANTPTLVTPVLGTPTSGTLTNCTGLPDTSVVFADNTTGNASTSNHGYLLKLNNSATQFMNGQGAWATPAGGISGSLTSGRVTVGAGASSVQDYSTLTYDGTTFLMTGAGPHGFGTSTAAAIQFHFGGSWAKAAPYSLFFDASLSPTANTSGVGLYIGPTFVEASSGDHAILAALQVVPTITNGASTCSDAMGIQIQAFVAATGTTNATGLQVSAPTGASNNRSINMPTGDIYKNGTAYTNPDYVLEYWATGKIEKYANNEGADKYRPFSLTEVRDFARVNHYLPQLDFFKAHDTEGPGCGGFERSDISLILHEDTFRYLWNHDDRIAQLEQRLNALQGKG